MRVPWTARKSNQSILKETGPRISLEGMMLKLKLSALATSCKELDTTEIDEETVERVSDFIFWAPKSLQMVTAAMRLKDACSLEEKL